VKIQKNPSTGSRDTDEKVLSSPINFPSLLVDRNHTYKDCGACVEIPRCEVKELNPSIESRDAEEKVYYSPSKVPFIIDLLFFT
jgi:hypothetical protein